MSSSPGLWLGIAVGVVAVGVLIWLLLSRKANGYVPTVLNLDPSTPAIAGATLNWNVPGTASDVMDSLHVSCKPAGSFDTNFGPTEFDVPIAVGVTNVSFQTKLSENTDPITVTVTTKILQLSKSSTQEVAPQHAPN